MEDDDCEDAVLRLEYEWLLHDEVQSVLTQLSGILQGCLQKFKSSGGSPSGIFRAANFLLSLPNSDAVRGLISIAGDSVIKADLKFKIPKVQNGSFGCFIFEHYPWKLSQLQDARNHLQVALDNLLERKTCGKFTSGLEVNQLLNSVMSSLSRGKSCLLVPDKLPLADLINNGSQRVLNPPIPDDMLVSFHVNCDKLVFSMYVFNMHTSPPSNLKTAPQDQSHIGHIFEANGRWHEIANKYEIICTVPWLKEIIVLFNAAQQLCQQLKDKINIFLNILSDTSVGKGRVSKSTDVELISFE